MTKDKALKLALDALEYHTAQTRPIHQTNETITAIKERLAQPEQEPVAWGVFEGNLHDMFFTQEEAQEMADLKGTHAEVRPLYTTPQRTWVGLTDKEKQDAYLKIDTWDNCVNFIEETLREKNSGHT
jgi:hypothetical protein